MAYKIWLCDLTYTQQVVSSDVMPAAVAGIGPYLLKKFLIFLSLLFLVELCFSFLSWFVIFI